MRRTILVFGDQFMKTAMLILLLAMSFQSLGAQAKEVAETPLNYQDETEASAALLFLDLYNQGLAGGKSGVCVDLDYDVDGRPQFKAAFDTSAFITGSSALKSDGGLNGQGFDSVNFQKLINALAKVQNGKVNTTIDGYADGQHYKSAPPFDLEESIKKNEKLSSDRAQVIAEIIKKNPNINVSKVSGHASPFWERKYPGMNDGLDCATRRKVVVTFDQPTPQIQNETKGSFFRTPESMDREIKKEIRKEFYTDIKEAQKTLKIDFHKRSFLNQRPRRSDVERIYAKLMKDHKLNPKCDLSPFKQMTLATIEIDITDFGKNNPQGKKEEIIESYVKESGFKTKDIRGGRSVLQEGCFVPSKKLNAQIQRGVKDYAVSGSSFMSSAGLKVKNGNVAVGFDVGSLKPQKVPHGPHKGEIMRGFYCRVCGNGLFFHEDSKNPGHFHPEYLDRVANFSQNDSDQKKFLSNLDELASKDPFSVSAFIKPRLFVVKNCRDCKCDHTALIKANDESVVTFDSMSADTGTQQIPATDFENACVIRPPVHHACNVKPNETEGKDQSYFQQKLTYESSMQNLKFTASNINELIRQVSNSCDADKKVLTADQKISDVICSADRLKQLPSDDEQADCAAAASNLAK